MKTLTLALLLTGLTFAQTTTPVTVPSTLPDVFLGAGAGLAPQATIGATLLKSNAEGVLVGAVRVTDKIYSVSTFDLTRTGNTLRTGAFYAAYSGKKFTVGPYVDGGLLFGSQTIGSYSAGAIMAFKVKGNFLFVLQPRFVADPAAGAGKYDAGAYVYFGYTFRKN